MFEFLLTNITYLFVYVYAKCGKEWATGNDQNHLTAVCVSIYDKNFLKATLGLILILYWILQGLGVAQEAMTECWP